MITGIHPLALIDGLFRDLPAIVVDDDFLEYLEEDSVSGSLDINEFAIYWHDWLKESTE